MKRSCASSSAAGGAERPAYPSSDLENKRQKCAQQAKLQAIVAYISFPLETHQRNAMEVIRQAKLYADVINLAFRRTMDLAVLWDDLEKEMESSAEQPAFDYRKNGPLITLFFKNACELVGERNVDIQGGVPSLCLTFNGPAGKKIIINASWPPFSSMRGKARMLDKCVSPAVEEMRTICLIGGPLAEPVFLETYIHKKNLDYNLSAKGSLCVLTNTFGRISEH